MSHRRAMLNAMANPIGRHMTDAQRNASVIMLNEVGAACAKAQAAGVSAADIANMLQRFVDKTERLARIVS